MTVRELISKLEEFHPDFEVAILDQETGHAIPEPDVYLGSAKEHPGPFVVFGSQWIGEDWGACREEDHNA